MSMNSITTRRTRRPGRDLRQRGQSLIVAVIVMFVLLFIGGIFVGLVARNLMNSGRSKDTISALSFAEAGIKYCNDNLMNSPEGADWRPAPTQLLNNQDPDQLWLKSGDWTRLDLGNGRALVRVSYGPSYIDDPSDPAPIKRKILDPLSKNVKIEAIGRVGFLDPSDPTTFLNTPAPRLRRELVAFKALGLTDFLRFETNINNESKFKADLGVPPVAVSTPYNYAGIKYPLAMQFGGLPMRTVGAVTSPNYRTPGAPMYINGAAEIHGDARFVLNPYNAEFLAAAGPITVSPNDASNPPLVTNAATNATGAITASDNAAYNTYGGIIRDISENPDINGYVRNISRLEPPRLDSVDTATGITRYRLLTRNSGRFLNNLNTGVIGMGGGIYIGNENDVEPESRNVAGGRSMRSVWLDPTTPNSRWNGPYYTPMAAYIQLGYPVVQARDANSDLIPNSYVATPGLRIVRDNGERFRDPAGRTAPAEVDFTFFIYKPTGQRPVIKLEDEFHRSALRQAPYSMTEKQIDKFLPAFNGVIFTEGNVRIRGLMPSKANIPIRRESGESTTDAQIRELVSSPAVSIVSGANIYIEGSIVRESADSMIALLANDYVVVNTTMFVGANKGMAFRPSNSGDTGTAEQAPYHALIDASEASSTPGFTMEFEFGDDPTQYRDASNNQVPVNLFMDHGIPGDGHTFINFALNDWAPRAGSSPLYPFSIPGLPATVAELASGTPGDQPLFFKPVYQIYPKPNTATYLFTGDPGYTWPQGLRNTFRPQLDLNYTQGAGIIPYAFGRTAVAPMDVRIEAIIYAQNGSFFVIPGYPLYTDPNDTRDHAIRRALEQNPSAPPGSMVRDPSVAPDFPFYGEPNDCRITIVGAISENKPASLADQAAWMQLWGYIPEVYGSTGANPPTPANERKIPVQHLYVGETGVNAPDQRTTDEKTARITRGIRFLYDPVLNAPYQGYDPAGRAFRTDDAYYNQANPTGTKDVGRVLPPVPRLPVCPGYVYYGEVR
jgi:hypothetical protein